MKRIILIGVISLMMSRVEAQGIKFEQGLSWAQVRAKAKSENKFIFMDCYATWCGPCMYMSQKVFPQKEVGDYFNAHFISVAVQMDRTVNDPNPIKKWYADAKGITAEYAVDAYPTYLFFSPDGNIADRLVGGYETKDFIAKAKDALDPEKQYYTLISGVQQHLTDSVYLRNALEIAEKSEDQKNAAKIAGYYLDCIKEPFKKDIVDLIIHSDPASKDRAFQFLLDNAPSIDKILDGYVGDKQYVEDKLGSTIARETTDTLFTDKDAVLNFNEIAKPLAERYPTLAPEFRAILRAYFGKGIDGKISTMLYGDGAPPPDWEGIDLKLKTLYPGFDCTLLLAKKQPEYYARKKMWPECEKSTVALLEQYGAQFSARDLNNYVWEDLFVHASDPQSLNAALKWGKSAVEKAPDNYFSIDTYANVLYKAGKINEALDWEHKAITKAEQGKDADGLKDFRANLEKMQKGEPTWGNTNAEQ